MRYHIIAALLLFATVSMAELNIVLKYVEPEEAAGEVLPEGQMTYVRGTNPADVRLGDNETAGGIRIGGPGGFDGVLTNDLIVGAHRIVLGGNDVHMIGGWGMLTGDGVLSVTNGVMTLSVFGSSLLRIVSEYALVQVLSFTWATPHFEAEFLADGDVPTLQFAPDIVAQDWDTVTPESVTTNDAGNLVIAWLPNTNTLGFYRAVLPTGADAAVVETPGRMKAEQFEGAGGMLTALDYNAITNPPAIPPPFDGEAASITIDASAFAGNLDEDVDDVQKLAAAVDGLVSMIYPSITNITLSGNVTWTPAVSGDVAIVALSGHGHTLTLGAPDPTNRPYRVSTRLVQGNPGTNSLTWAGVQTPGGVALTPATGTNVVSVIDWQWQGAAWSLQGAVYDVK